MALAEQVAELEKLGAMIEGVRAIAASAVELATVQDFVTAVKKAGETSLINTFTGDQEKHTVVANFATEQDAAAFFTALNRLR